MIGTYGLSNNSAVVVNEIDHDNDKVKVDIVVGDKVLSSHCVKFNHLGFRIGKLYIKWAEVMRAGF